MVGEKPRAVVLLSGGIDSATTLAVAASQDFECYALTVDYGQRHATEVASARAVAKALGATRHLVLRIDMREIGASALTDDLEVPKGRGDDEIGVEIPITYVPARNAVLLSLALAWAEALEATDIFIGANAVDYSGYPDCRPEFIESFEETARLATKCGVEGRGIGIKAPLIDMTKSETILLGASLGVDYSLTHSCYDPPGEGIACGSCDSCILRKRGFAGAGIPDPTKYA